jgi:hypothetical protein
MLDSYNTAMLQKEYAADKLMPPADLSYYKNYLLREGLPTDKSWIEGKIVDCDGLDVTEQVKTAERALLDRLM